MYTNVWYVAARSADLIDKPLYVKMLGSDFVLFRDKKGNAVCLNNVCPHRGASLANGTLSEEGYISCPFHGWEFNGLGTYAQECLLSGMKIQIKRLQV